jgi:hypothetical protein
MLMLRLLLHTGAAGLYAIDEEMQKLGTAAVHLLTIATSHMKAHPDEDAS